MLQVSDDSDAEESIYSGMSDEPDTSSEVVHNNYCLTPN